MKNATRTIARAAVGTILTVVLGSGFALTAGASIANMAGDAEFGIVVDDEEADFLGGTHLAVWRDATIDQTGEQAGDGAVNIADLNVWN